MSKAEQGGTHWELSVAAYEFIELEFGNFSTPKQERPFMRRFHHAVQDYELGYHNFSHEGSSL
ncbi:MAG: hypothetical protein ACYDHA_12735 [Bellilinea sp.]